jgi:hypothetical protein
MIALMRNQSCVFDIYVVVSRNGHCMVEIIQSFDQGSAIWPHASNNSLSHNASYMAC